MSEETNAAPAPAPQPETTAKPKSERLRKAVSVLKRHPLGVVALFGVAAALVEIELAVGILTGIGATALLVTKSGPEAREEVLAKGKAAIERARVVLATRAKPAAEAAPAPVVAPVAAAAPAENPSTPSA